MTKIYIIILTYNGFEDVSKCLNSLYHLKNNAYVLNTLIVDNGSYPVQISGLEDFLGKNKKKFSFLNIKLIKNYKNLGFAKGNNIGIKIALENEADFVLLLNNDVVLEMNFLLPALNLKPDIISPAVKFSEFKDKKKLLFDLGGYVNWITGRTTHFNANNREYQRLRHSKPINVDYVAGCCMLISRKVLETIGLLDEKYFIYFEDVDYCIRAKKSGFNVLVDPGSQIYHKLGGSMDRWSNRAIFHNLYSNFIFISKHLRAAKLTGYAYLMLLAAKILKDRFIDLVKGRELSMESKKWKGARHNKII